MPGPVLPAASGFIGCSPEMQAATAADLNTEATTLETAANTLQTKIEALEGLWSGNGKDAFDALMISMKKDFDAANVDLVNIGKMCGDFGINVKDMDDQHAISFQLG